jgi:hypothetical protein
MFSFCLPILYYKDAARAVRGAMTNDKKSH